MEPLSVVGDDSLRSQFPSDLWKDYLFNLQSQVRPDVF
jgi:hypothetical protein